MAATVMIPAKEFAAFSYCSLIATDLASEDL